MLENLIKNTKIKKIIIIGTTLFYLLMGYGCGRRDEDKKNIAPVISPIINPVEIFQNDNVKIKAKIVDNENDKITAQLIYNNIYDQQISMNMESIGDNMYKATIPALYQKLENITENTLKDYLKINIMAKDNGNTTTTSIEIPIYPTKDAAERIFTLATQKNNLQYEINGVIRINDEDINSDVLVKNPKGYDIILIYKPTTTIPESDRNVDKELCQQYGIPYFEQQKTTLKKLFNNTDSFIKINK